MIIYSQSREDPFVHGEDRNWDLLLRSDCLVRHPTEEAHLPTPEHARLEGLNHTMRTETHPLLPTMINTKC